MTNQGTADRLRFGLPKSQILRGHEAFQKVFSGSQRIQARYLRCYFHIEKQIPPYTCMVGFAVKKAGNAVRRNRSRRFMKESWRVRRTQLLEQCMARELRIRCVLLLDMTKLSTPLHFNDVDEQIHFIMSELEAGVARA